MGNIKKNLQERSNITSVAVNNANEIGKIVRTHRKMADLTQLGLAELAGVGKTVIFDIEKGKSTVKFETLLKVFKTLNISFNLNSPILNKDLENY